MLVCRLSGETAVRKTSVIGTTTVAVTLAILGLSSSCGSDSPDARAEEPTVGSLGIDRCALLTDDEVTQVLGAHDGGKADLGNTWGLGSCLWKTKGFPQGNAGLIEVAVFDDEFVESSLRRDADRERADGFAVPVDAPSAGALYNSTSGTLWFNCAKSRFCAIRVGVRADAKQNEQTAIRLARLVEGRLPRPSG